MSSISISRTCRRPKEPVAVLILLLTVGADSEQVAEILLVKT